MTAPVVALSHEPLDAAAVAAAVADAEHGGTALFVGTTRAESGARAVVALEYEAYALLAVAEMGRIVDEMAQRYRGRTAIVHRLGVVRVGEPAVVVATSARHRAAAFAACIDAMDLLKADVPIWKCTHHADGARVWDAGAGVPTGAGELSATG